MDDEDCAADALTPPARELVHPSPGAGRHEAIDFAPHDLTDGRPENQWASRYTDRRAIVQMVAEGTYLAVLIAVAAVALTVIWLGTPRTWLGIDEARYVTFRVYAFAWLSGMLGGTLFTVKWLYHSIGKGFWNVDRLAWRLFTPHLSGGFSFGLIALATSGIFDIVDRGVLRSGPAVVGVGFLLGYFSDYTVARLYKAAQNLLGGPREPA